MARVQGVEVRNGLQGNDGAIGRRRPDPSAFLYPEDVEEAGRGVEIQDRPVWKNDFCREWVSVFAVYQTHQSAPEVGLPACGVVADRVYGRFCERLGKEQTIGSCARFMICWLSWKPW